MSTSVRDWLNFILTALAAGLTTYGAALASGAKANSAVAVITGITASVTAALNLLRERPDLSVTVNKTP